MSEHTKFLDDRAGAQLLKKKGLQLVSVGQVGKQLKFESPARISSSAVIGSCTIGAFSYVGIGSEIRNSHIGRFCSIAANVALGPAEHPVDWLSSHPFQFNGVKYFEEYPEWDAFASDAQRFSGNAAHTYIGHDVWIGRNVVVRQGVRVGSGAVLASGAFVNKDVEPYAVVAGVPARVIRHRFKPDIIEKLLRLEWWNWRLESKVNGIDFRDIDIAVNKIASLTEAGKLERFSPVCSVIEKVSEGYELRGLP